MNKEASAQIEKFLRAVAEGILENPEEVKYDLTQGERTIMYEMRIPKKEFGRIIGKGGKHINAIATLATAIGAKYGCWTTINAVEKEGER